MHSPRKLPQPALNRGRVQRAARRAFLMAAVLTTADVAELAFARKRLLHGRLLEPHDYRLARRALELIADPIRRGSGQGRPTLWRLRNSDEKEPI